MATVSEYDVVVVGAGPAGMSAIGWCAELGLSAVMIEREPAAGGQLNFIHGPINNYLGLSVRDGHEILGHFWGGLPHGEFIPRLSREVVSSEFSTNSLRLDSDEEVRYRCLIIATGVRRRRLQIPGELEFQGKGILESGMRDAPQVEGKNVVIVGGGDAAAENALILSHAAKSLTVVHRGSSFSAREDFLTEIAKRDNIRVLFDSRLNRILGGASVSGVEVAGVGEGNAKALACDAVLIRIGVEPNSELFGNSLELDERGYIVVDALGQTRRRGVFAVGDVANPVSPTISTAAGTGATAAKAAYELIKAG